MTPISGPDVGEDILIPFSTIGADTDGPSPSPAPCPTDVGWGDDLWYCWEAPCDTNATFETCGLTNLDTIISVYYSVGAPCVCPAFDTPPIACNDDACGVQSALTIPVEEGQRYLIRLGAVAGQPEGSGMLRIAIDPICNPDPRLPADLEVTKTDDPDPVQAGSNLTYSLLVRNYGPGVAENVVLGDHLDPMVEFVSAAVSPGPGNCNYDAGEHRVTCHLGDMLPDSEKEIAIVVHVPSDAVVWERPDCGTKIISNDAWVLSRGRIPTNGDGNPGPGTPDPNPGNNHTGENTTVVESADLKIIKLSKPDDEIQAGVPFLYTIIVENCGPSYARGVTIRDTILSNENFETTFVASNYPRGDSTNGFTFNPIADPDGGESIELLLHPALPPKSANDTGRWWVQFEVVAFETSDINNIANVFTRGDGICPGTPDPDTSNNEAIDSISILDTSDLRVDKYATRSVRCSPDTCTDATTEGGATATAGRQLTYLIRVQNQIPAPGEPGGSTATNVVLMDYLPAGVQFVNVFTPEGGLDIDCIPGVPGDPMNPVICNLGTIDPNDTFELELTVRIDEDYIAGGLYGTYVRNVACVTSDNIDPDTSDNCEDDVTPVYAVADVYVEKVADPDEVVAGEAIGYTVNVGNNGCSTADDVEVIDALPEQVTFVDATVLNGTGDEVCAYNAGSHEVVCSLGDLDPGDLRIIVINATVNQTAFHVLYNRVDAYILGDTYDCYEGNNSDRTWTDVERNSDLSITKTADPDPVFAGDSLIYTVTTTNHGPSDAFGAFFVDALPSEVNYLASATDEQGFLFGDEGPCHILSGGWAAEEFDGCDGQFLLCVVGPLPAGDSEVTRIKVQVRADAVTRTECGSKTIINKAIALNAELGGCRDCCDPRTSSGDCALRGAHDEHDIVIDEDPNFLNNFAIQGTFVMDQADLSVYKVSKPDDEVRAGEPFRYTIIVENWGPSFARNVFIRDDIFASGEFTVVPGSGTTNRPVIGPFPIDGPAPGESFNLALEQPLEPSTLTQVGRWIVQFDIVANDPIDINNRVEVGSYDNDVDCPGTPDPDHSNNIATDEISVTAVADLTLEKTADPNDVVEAGSQLSYHIGITNSGPSAAENVVVKDAIPAGVTVVSVSGSGPNGDAGCNTGTPGDVLDPATCNFGTLDPNDAAWMNIVVTVDYDLPPQLLCNNARAYSDTFDIDNGNNIDHACVQVILPDEADLEVTKTATPDPVISGEHLIYTITVRNHGPNVAHVVGLYDELDDDVTVVEIDKSQTIDCVLDNVTTGDGQVVDCELGDLPPGAVRTVRVKVHVDEDAVAYTEYGTDALYNSVHVDSETSDPDESNNWFNQTTFAMELADLSVVKVSKPDDHVLAGVPFEYTIIVENLGPSEARAVQIVDDLISSGEVQVLDIQPDRGECFIDDSDPTYQVMRCELYNPLEVQGVDGSGRWTIQVTAVASETQDVNNFVRVFTGVYDFNDFRTVGFTWESGTPDPNQSNNQAYDSISIVDTSNLSLTKSALGELETCELDGSTPPQVNEVTAGRLLTYTLEVTNQIPVLGDPGGSTAEGVVLKDYLPYGVEVVSLSNADPNGVDFGCLPGTPGNPADPATCNLGNLAPGETAAVEIVVLVKPNYVLESATDLLQNGACVTSDNVDPDISDNLANNTTSVSALADLYIEKLDAPDPVVAGQSLTYAIWVENNGPSTAEQVGLLDTLGDEMTFSGAAILGGGGTCTYAEGAHSVACSLGNIAPGDVRIVHIEVLINADAEHAGNTAVIDSLTDDCDEENNYAQAWTDVERLTDLEVTKSADPNPVVAGEQLLYTVNVTNHGPSIATDVNLVDYLPGDAAYISDDRPECSEALNSVMCYIGTLDVGETFTVHVLTHVNTDTVADSDLGGETISNHAEVAGAESDPDLDNNEVWQETFVVDSADLSVTKLSVPDTHVPAGQEFVYKIIVENLGPSYSRGVKITDDIFSSGDFASISFEDDPNRNDTCFDLNEILLEELSYQCMLNEPLEPVGPDGAGRWIITVRIVANEPQDVHNIVRVFTGDELGGGGGGVTSSVPLGDPDPAAGTPDPNLDNNQAIDFISVDAVADLAIEKTSDVQEVAQAGDIVTYTLDVTNNGPSAAVNVVVKDFLPLHVNVQSISSTKGNCTAGTPGDPLDPAMCHLDTMDVNDVETITIEVMLDEEIPSGILFNDAYVSSDTFDADNSNNLDNESFDVIGAMYADLSIFKTGKPDGVVRAGDELTYTIFVDNLGPDTAEDVRLTEEIISDGMFDVLSVTDDRGAVCDPTSGQFDQHATIICELPSLEPVDSDGNGRWTLVIVVKAVEGISINNEACVVSETVDPNHDNNCALTTHDVLEVSNLNITKDDDPDPVAEGALLTYLLTVGNGGPTTAENVVVEDSLSSRVDIVSVTPSQGNCTIGTPGDVLDPTRCNLGTIAVGDEATVEIVVRVHHDCNFAPLINNAKTYSDLFDDDIGDNIVSEFTEVVDGTPPVITCPAPITVTSPNGDPLPSGSSAIVAFLNGASATDDCDPDPEITNNGPATYPLGPTEVTFTATDDFGNMASCTSTVTVVSGAPDTRPIVDDIIWEIEAIVSGNGGGLCGASLMQTTVMGMMGLMLISLTTRRRR